MYSIREHSTIRKYKLKQQWYATTKPLECLKSYWKCEMLTNLPCKADLLRLVPKANFSRE